MKEHYIKNNKKIQVLTPDGFSDFDGIVINTKQMLRFHLENNIYVDVSYNHPFCVNQAIINSNKLKIGDCLYHKTDGLQRIIKIEELGEGRVADLTNVVLGSQYWGNDILSHNCFHGSSYTLIPPKNLKEFKEYGERKDKLEPTEEDIDLHGLFKIKVWEQPIKGHTYIVGADTGEGIGKDFSTALVFDISDTSDIRQVASFADNTIGQTEFSYVLAKIGKKYDNAFIAMENNGISKVTVENLWLFFEYENLINYGTKDPGRIGIHSHNSIKVNACLWLKDMMSYDDMDFTLNDTQLIYEMGWFERKVPSHMTIFQAVNGKNDDYMMAFIWAMYCIHSGIIDNYFIVEKYFTNAQGIEIPHIIKNFNDSYYEEGDTFSRLIDAEFNQKDNIDNKFESLKNRGNDINNNIEQEGFGLASSLYGEDDGWVNL